jgi:hypothetical protein
VKRQHKWLAGGATAAIAVLLWPGQAVHADTSLGGYEGIASAAVVHVEIYDPTIPIPSEPQGDGSIGYTKSNVESGPTSRALSSYLWPGVVLGDGWDQLTHQPGTQYPVQANSRYPATNTAPATNTIQLTDGNGMTTSTDGLNSDAKVTLLGIAGDGTSPLSGIGTGLSQLNGQAPSAAPSSATSSSAGAAPAAPVNVGGGISALASAKTVTSESKVTVADKTVTAEAHAAVANLSLLGGIITIKGLDVESKVVSDGTKATPTEATTIGSISLLNGAFPIKLGTDGVDLGLPALSDTVTGLLKTLGIEIKALPVTKTADGASATMSNRALQISIDTKPLKSVLDNILNPIVAGIPQSAKDQLSPILGLGPKIVLTIGTSDTSASAAPAYNGGGGDTGTTGGTGGSTGGGSGSTGGTGGGAGLLPPSGNQPQTGGTGNTTLPPAVPQAYSLPGLADVPRGLIVGGILLAAAIGWAVTRYGGLLFGGGANCDYGLATGVPDLRKG